MEAAMRSEEEMMNLILQVAKDDERVTFHLPPSLLFSEQRK